MATASTHGGAPERLILTVLHTTRRSLVGFLIVVAAFAAADPTLPSLFAGAVLSLTGELLRIVTAGFGYKAGEHSLRGPYRFVRHPYFLGSALLFLGFCVAGRNPWVTGSALVALTLLYAFEIEADERKVRSRLGPAFLDYRSKVPAFLPKLIPYRGAFAGDAEGAHFSLGLSLFTGRHREFDALLGLVLGFGLLYGVLQLSAGRPYFRVAVLAAVGLYVVARVIYYAVVKRPAS